MRCLRAARPARPVPQDPRASRHAFANGIHFNNPLNWATRIRLREVWDRLTSLRRLALQGGFDRVASLFTNTLYGIDAPEP